MQPIKRSVRLTNSIILKLALLYLLLICCSNSTYAIHRYNNYTNNHLTADSLTKSDRMAFNELAKFLAQTVRYPNAARAKYTTGRVIVGFMLSPTGRITDVTIIKSVADGCDEAVKNALFSFRDKKHNLKTGEYKLSVDFDLNGKAFNEPIPAELKNDPTFLNQIIISGYSR